MQALTMVLLDQFKRKIEKYVYQIIVFTIIGGAFVALVDDLTDEAELVFWVIRRASRHPGPILINGGE